MKILKLIILLSLLMTSSLYSQLAISMSTDKDNYEYGELIEIKCRITNTADTTFQFLAGTYRTCQAEFSFNDFESYEYESCLTLSELLIFEPHTSKVYTWIIDPFVYGLPDKEGTQQIVGSYYFDLVDTIKIEAKQFLGGQVSVGYMKSDSATVNTIIDSLNAEVIYHEEGLDQVSEVWQIIGHQIDSVNNKYNEDTVFTYFQKNIFVEYESIKDESPLDFYPLRIGNYWEYRVERYMSLPSENVDSSWNASSEIIGDTLLENNKKYYIFKDVNMGTISNPKYIRIDSSNGLVYQKFALHEEYVIDSLLAQKGDTLNCHYIKDIYSKKLFANEVETKVYDQHCISMTGSESWELSKNFGLTSRIVSDYSVFIIQDEYELIYARINDVEYGIKSSLVNNFSGKKRYSLEQNYPNPFNPTTKISYSIPSQSHVSLKVFDVLGREVVTLVNNEQPIGNYSIEFDASSLTSGIYFYRIQAGQFIESKKMVLLK